VRHRAPTAQIKLKASNLGLDLDEVSLFGLLSSSHNFVKLFAFFSHPDVFNNILELFSSSSNCPIFLAAFWLWKETFPF